MRCQVKRYFVRYRSIIAYGFPGTETRVAGPYRSEKRAETAKQCLSNLGGCKDFEVFYEYIGNMIPIIR